MWTRSELKSKGKYAMRRNYWKCVIAALFLTFIVGGFSPEINYNTTSYDNSYSMSDESYIIDEEDIPYVFDQDKPVDVFFNTPTDNHITIKYHGLPISMLLSFGILIVVAGLLLDIFIFSPMEVGARKYFIDNSNESGDLKDFLFVFNSDYYLNIVKIQFLRSLYTFLWALLFVVPGIVKSYEYQMIPYLLAQDPNLSSQEVFYTSKKMMLGHKWNSFILDFSFIGWHLLSALTFGIVGVFYVSPYVYATQAELYLTLKENEYSLYDERGI